MRLRLQTCRVMASLAILLSVTAGARADAVTDWNEIAVQTIIAPPARPVPISFLDMAIVQAAVYDAVQAIDRRFEPYHVEIPGASGSPEAAAAKAAHDVLVYLFPAQAASLDTTFQQYLAAHGLSDSDPGVAVGATAAAGIIALRTDDGRFPPNQVPFVGGPSPGEWRPTESFIGPPFAPLSFAPMLAPWLGDVTPFTLKESSQFRAAPPPPLNSGRYAKDYDEVKALGARFNSDRTLEQTDLAIFWAAQYAVLWNRALQGIAAAHVHNIGDSARLFALANMAMADAIITNWNSKNVYVFWRPITAIRLGNDGTNRRTVGDPDWQPLINTPNYPSYPSGASAVTAAATHALALYFGTDEFTFTVTTTNAAAVQQTRTYTSFTDAAEDVVIARVYEGIHFRFDDEAGEKQGNKVAHWAFTHFLKPL
jgi:hypothetical protein